MKIPAIALLIATAWSCGHAQSLPPCKGTKAEWTDCVGLIKFSDGESYKGGFKSGVPHGHGVYTWKDGQRYEGDFLNGNFHGQATWTWPDGTIYVGNFKNNKTLRDGVMTFPATPPQ